MFASVMALMNRIGPLVQRHMTVLGDASHFYREGLAAFALALVWALAHGLARRVAQTMGGLLN